MYSHQFVPSDQRLGRHVQHDPQSLRYTHGVLPKAAIKSVDWARRAPIFDQGHLGSCTGNAAAGLIGTDCSARPGHTSVTVDGAVLPVDESLAVKVYSVATQLDAFQGAYPPEDTGSSGLGAAKALVKLGLASAYNHAFSLSALASALQSGPAMVGTVWLESMFDVDPDGFVVVDRKSQVAGGHEYVISAYDATRKAYRLDNSWGDGWGIRGSAWCSQTNLAWLLSQDGDTTIPVWATAPDPAPAPAITAEELADKVRAVLTANGV